MVEVYSTLGAQRMNLKRNLSRLTVVLALLALGSCVVYQPVPMPMQQSRFDQSWAAASGALFDQGLTITMQDRSTGVIRGEGATRRLPPRSRRCRTVAFRSSFPGRGIPPSSIGCPKVSIDAWERDDFRAPSFSAASSPRSRTPCSARPGIRPAGPSRRAWARS